MSVNPINVRLPQFDLATEEGRQSAHRYLASGIVDLNQAIAYIKPVIDSTAKTANAAASTTTSGVTSFNSETGTVVYFPQLGTVNNQLGNSSYQTQQTDNGAKIIVGDSSAVTVTLNPLVTAPWFTIIDNDSSSIASLSGVVNGETSIPPGGFGIVYFDGADFWCGATRLASDSTLGYVQPDGVTIGIDSGMIYTQISVDSGAPMITPGTPGNPFYFDSTATPWHGWVWWGDKWNQFS